MLVSNTKHKGYHKYHQVAEEELVGFHSNLHKQMKSVSRIDLYEDTKMSGICLPLQASINERNAKTESTRTGRSGSRIPVTTLCNALRKLFGSAKFIWAYCPATHAACYDRKIKH